MAGGVKMLAGVLVLGGIAAAHVAALQAQAKVDPGVAGFDAILADVLIGAGNANLVQVSALCGHEALLAG
jgi:hypothetical protein